MDQQYLCTARRWLWPFDLWPFDHHYEEDPALVPPSNPTNAPTINAIADRSLSEEPQNLV